MHRIQLQYRTCTYKYNVIWNRKSMYIVHYGSAVFAIHESAKYLNNDKVVLKSVQQTWYTIHVWHWYFFSALCTRLVYILFNYLCMSVGNGFAVKIGRYILRHGLGLLFLFSFTCSSTVI